MLCFANVFYLFIYFLWPPYSPALVNGGSRKFYTWWTLSVIREVSTWIFLCYILLPSGVTNDDDICCSKSVEISAVSHKSLLVLLMETMQLVLGQLQTFNVVS